MNIINKLGIYQHVVSVFGQEDGEKLLTQLTEHYTVVSEIDHKPPYSDDTLIIEDVSLNDAFDWNTAPQPCIDGYDDCPYFFWREVYKGVNPITQRKMTESQLFLEQE